MNDPARIWVVDDDHGVRFVLATALLVVLFGMRVRVVKA